MSQSYMQWHKLLDVCILGGFEVIFPILSAPGLQYENMKPTKWEIPRDKERVSDAFKSLLVRPSYSPGLLATSQSDSSFSYSTLNHVREGWHSPAP